MALTGIQIFKLLPKTNCKECGVPTCLAFAMNLASGKAELDSCPYVSDEAKAQLAEASAPPIRPVALGKGVRKTTTGGETELASTRAAWAAMPEALKSRIRGKVLRHNYRRSREVFSKELADLPMFNKWPPQRWPAVWPNPVNGREALYIASHVFEVEGMTPEAGRTLVDELTAFCTQPQFTYAHEWNIGDVLMWDQRAVMHRGMPWPYDEPRTLKSTCSSMTNADGLAQARAAL